MKLACLRLSMAIRNQRMNEALDQLRGIIHQAPKGVPRRDNVHQTVKERVKGPCNRLRNQKTKD